MVSEALRAAETTYRVGKKSNLWMTFEPTGSELNPTWTFQLTARNRGGSKVLAMLWETTALKPIGSVTIKGETYPLTIAWHEQRRGGLLCLGGERKMGLEGATIAWEMQIKPGDGGRRLDIESRLRSNPRREGRVVLRIHCPLYQPEIVSLPSAAARNHRAVCAWSNYHKYAAVFVSLADVNEEVGWDEGERAYRLAHNGFPFGGGKAIRLSAHFAAAANVGEARQFLVEEYADVAASNLHPPPVLRILDPTQVVERFVDQKAFHTVGIERLYPEPPVESPPETYFAGHPHYPLDMLASLWNWQRLHMHREVPRLVRFGGTGIAADFQVMGREGQPEPNKGAFWDRLVVDARSDWTGQATHGIAANARMARGLFWLHDDLCEPLFRQAGINICQWLLLKHNDAGYFSGDKVYATLGLTTDGKVAGDPDSLDGVVSILPLVQAYRITKNEVFIKAARKVADHASEWISKRQPESAVATAWVIMALLAIDAEAPSEKLQAIVREWGSALRLLPIDLESPEINYDSLHAGVFDCASAAFRLHSLEGDPDYLRYAFSALGSIPGDSYQQSWRSIRAYFDAMLSLVSTIPEIALDYDIVRVKQGWRDFSPDQAAENYLKLTSSTGEPVDALTLVCRATGQVMSIVLAPPTVNDIEVLNNGKRPIVRDLCTGTLDTIVTLQRLIGEDWAKFGLFTIDP